MNTRLADPCYNDRDYKVPLKDLRCRSNGKWIEILVLDKEVKTQHDDQWDQGRIVAKFTAAFAQEARQFAEDLANQKMVYCGGVLIR